MSEPEPRQVSQSKRLVDAGVCFINEPHGLNLKINAKQRFDCKTTIKRKKYILVRNRKADNSGKKYL